MASFWVVCLWKKRLQGDSSLLARAGLAGLQRLAVALGVMQVSQVAVHAISLNTVPVSTWDRNVTTLTQWAQT